MQTVKPGPHKNTPVFYSSCSFIARNVFSNSKKKQKTDKIIVFNADIYSQNFSLRQNSDCLFISNGSYLRIKIYLELTDWGSLFSYVINRLGRVGLNIAFVGKWY